MSMSMANISLNKLTRDTSLTKDIEDIRFGTDSIEICLKQSFIACIFTEISKITNCLLFRQLDGVLDESKR